MDSEREAGKRIPEVDRQEFLIFDGTATQYGILYRREMYIALLKTYTRYNICMQIVCDM